MSTAHATVHTVGGHRADSDMVAKAAFSALYHAQVAFNVICRSKGIHACKDAKSALTSLERTWRAIGEAESELRANERAATPAILVRAGDVWGSATCRRYSQDELRAEAGGPRAPAMRLTSVQELMGQLDQTPPDPSKIAKLFQWALWTQHHIFKLKYVSL